MSDRPLNHFGNLCHGKSPNAINRGHPVDYDLLYQIYGKDGDGTDLGFDNHSDFVLTDEIPDSQTEEDFWSALGMSVIDAPEAEDLPSDDDLPFPEEEDPLWQDFLKSFTNEQPVVEQDEECLCIGFCGCNHRNRNPEVHSRKGEHYEHGRRSASEQRKLARQRRQSIRRMSDMQLIHLL
ncbi:MAG: hypothetical protein KBC35_01015 [Candidatus Pacebacteria bacterium]|nr:hypothetical protein [Candidatus Paceibacterota bacterium]